MSDNKRKYEYDGRVHYDNPIYDSTLCGCGTDEMEPDINGLSVATLSAKKVNCLDCLAIIKFCKECKL